MLTKLLRKRIDHKILFATHVLDKKLEIQGMKLHLTISAPSLREVRSFRFPGRLSDWTADAGRTSDR